MRLTHFYYNQTFTHMIFIPNIKEEEAENPGKE